jgi:hypothetical protein
VLSLPPHASDSASQAPFKSCRSRHRRRQSRRRIAADSRLLDDLIGCGKQGRWHRDAERLGSLGVDDQFKLVRLLNRNITGLRPTQDLSTLSPACRKTRNGDQELLTSQSIVRLLLMNLRSAHNLRDDDR